MRTKPDSKLRVHLWPVLLLAGIALLLVTFFSATRTDMDTAEDHLSDTVNYISQQCATYSSLNLASEAKGLMRIMGAVQQVGRDLSRDGGRTDRSTLASYADELYLTGIILLDPEGGLVGEYCADGLGLAALANELTKTAVLDVALHPEKTYAARASFDDGTYADLAAYGRTDVPGVVVAYYHTPAEYINSYSLSFQNLLSGYSIERDGTIVVTKGDRVVASNDESLIGRSTDEVATLLYISQRAANGKLVHVPRDFTGLTHSFGMIDRGRDYYVYACLTERSVFESTPRKLLFAALGYFFLLLLFQLFRWKTQQRYQEDRLTRERDYQEKLKEAADRAESANRAKTEFLQRMSHDIRTPINGIRGMVEIGSYYADDPEKQAECRQKIWDASGLLLDLVNEVLDMGKLESGEIVLEERPFHMPTLLNEIGSTVGQTAAGRGITVTRQPRLLPHPDLIGSPLHLKRLLLNLLSNAVKYNKDNGSVTLACREIRKEGETAWIEFICADTGIGMSEEFQQHLFEPFTQENNDARSTYGGTGLGMPIAKSLVDKMGGAIEFESEKDVGTTFRVTLPFRIDVSGTGRTERERPAGAVSLAGAHILLAEDNDLNMEIAEFLLGNAGATVAGVRNGQEAVELFRQSVPGEFDAILMDVMMPVMDGYQATRAIRALDRPDAAAIPIIAMTANAFAEDAQKAYAAGMNEHITKPLDARALVQALAGAIGAAGGQPTEPE